MCWAALLVPNLAGGTTGHDHLLRGATIPGPGVVLVFIGSWLVMIGAMMLPTTVPMVRMFAVVSARQPRPWPARAAFLAGYLALWTAFALLAVVAATAVQAGLAWLDLGPRWVLAGALAIAGAFQFSPIKNRCMTQCRDPRAFLFLNYRRGVRGGWALGLRHGWSCLGCCWALMLVMFGTGVGNVAAMVALTAVMVAEKTTRWGKWITAPVGVVLLFLAAAVALGLGAPGPDVPVPAHVHAS
ncbi:MAG: DUF2182 domain-containing protein [Pseudonocardia sp.]|nr:DUF2182 domain-containing protein [Pseudonocardia sp.]